MACPLVEAQNKVPAKTGEVVVLCGRLVASAFGLRAGGRLVPWTEEQQGVRFLVLPHPSGAFGDLKKKRGSKGKTQTAGFGPCFHRPQPILEPFLGLASWELGVEGTQKERTE